MYVVVKPFNTVNRRLAVDAIVSPLDIEQGSAMSFEVLRDRGFIKAKHVDYDAMTRAELDAMALQRGVDVSSAKSKADVVAAIEYADKSAEAAQSGNYDGLLKGDLEHMATERGIDISTAKTKADLIDLLQHQNTPAPLA